MLFSLQVSDVVEFPMTAMTGDETFQVDLSWDPIEIETEKNKYSAKVIIANDNAYETIFKLIGKEKFPKKYIKSIHISFYKRKIVII